MEQDAKLDLKYARFVRDDLEERGILVDPVLSYLELVTPFVQPVPRIEAVDALLDLATRHRLDHLQPVIGQARDDLLRRQQAIPETRRRIKAIKEATARTEQAINRARSSVGLPAESVARRDDSFHLE